MIRNYLVVLFRNLLKSPVYSLINILGLSAGLTCGILILMWVTDELDYNKCHKNYDHLYRVYEIQNYSGGIPFYTHATPTALQPFLKKSFPEVQECIRFSTIPVQMKYADKVFKEQSTVFADTSVCNVLTIEFVKGDPKTCLKDKNSVIMTEETAARYFGKADPIGRVIRINDVVNVNVTAIVKNLPRNTNFRFNCLLPIELLKTIHGRDLNEWGTNFLATLVILRDNASIPILEQKVNFLQKSRDPQSRTTFHFRPVSEIRLKSLDPAKTGNDLIVKILTSSAIFLLLIACINFMNLSTARSANRAKEVGIRKVVGSDRRMIIIQFLGESLIISFFSFGFAILLTDLFLPTFNQLANKSLSMSDWSLTFTLGLIGLTIFVGLFSGSYPAIYLSRFMPSEVLKGSLRKGARSATFRKIMVILQFTLTIILMINTTFIFKQLLYVQNKEIGIDRTDELILSFDQGLNSKFEVLRSKLKSLPEVSNVTVCDNPPVNIGNSTSGARWDGCDTVNGTLFTFLIADHELVETVKLKIVEGRGFNKEFPTDTANFLVNETAARIIGIKPIIGANFSIWGVRGKIIGVVKDFHYQHMEAAIDPLFIMSAYTQWANNIVIRLNAKDMDNAVKKVQKVIKEVYPDYPFEKGWISDVFDDIYQTERQVRDILKYFTILALFISCLGLLALSAYIAEQQSKEMVIRKVHGASVFQIVGIMIWNFGKWVIISSVIAVPIALYTVSTLFKTYAYHTPISAWVFLAACLGAIFIAVLTVLYQAVKTANRNPVNYLKYE